MLKWSLHSLQLLLFIYLLGESAFSPREDCKAGYMRCPSQPNQEHCVSQVYMCHHHLARQLDK